MGSPGGEGTDSKVDEVSDIGHSFEESGLAGSDVSWREVVGDFDDTKVGVADEEFEEDPETGGV